MFVRALWSGFSILRAKELQDFNIKAFLHCSMPLALPFSHQLPEMLLPIITVITCPNLYVSLFLDLAGRFFPRSSILNTSDILNGFADGVYVSFLSSTHAPLIFFS